jgi:hypothetical protein
LTLLGAVEAGQVAGQKSVQAVPAAADIGWGNVGVGEQGLRRRVLQDSRQKNPLIKLSPVRLS